MGKFRASPWALGLGKIPSFSIGLYRDLEKFQSLLLYIMGSGIWENSDFLPRPWDMGKIPISPPLYRLWDLDKIRAILSMDMKHVSIAGTWTEIYTRSPRWISYNPLYIWLDGYSACNGKCPSSLFLHRISSCRHRLFSFWERLHTCWSLGISRQGFKVHYTYPLTNLTYKFLKSNRTNLERRMRNLVLVYLLHLPPPLFSKILAPRFF